MAYAVEQSFESILSRILQDYANQLPDVDQAVGTLVYIRSSMLAACEWGIRKEIAWLARQILPDTAESAQIDRYLAGRGLTRAAGETDAEAVARLLSYMQEPPAGGNKYDWPRWATEVSATVNDSFTDPYSESVPVDGAYLDENGRGLGTINLAIASNRSLDPDEYTAWQTAHAYTAGDLVKDSSYSGSDGTIWRVYQALTSGTSTGTGVRTDAGVTWIDTEGYATDGLLSQVAANLETKRPLGIWDYEVYKVTKAVVAVTMTITGDVDVATVAAAVRSYMVGLTTGETLSTAHIIATALDAGADDVTTLTLPAANYTPTCGPTVYQRVWPGVITVSK